MCVCVREREREKGVCEGVGGWVSICIQESEYACVRECMGGGGRFAARSRLKVGRYTVVFSTSLTALSSISILFMAVVNII